MPLLNCDNIGYGFGKKDLEILNAVRVFIADNRSTDTIYKLECNIDDMTSEEIAFATETLIENGARDVYTTAVQMKKNRQGHIITVITDIENKDKIVNLMFKFLSTLGIREEICSRYILDREEIKVKTKYGDVRKKVSSGYGVKKEKYEYDDISKIAKENNMSIKDILFEI